MISIICANNNDDVLNNNLIKTLNEQTYNDYELIIVDTTKKKYEGATDALNYGASKAKGDYLLFCHNDINFLDKNSLKDIVDNIDSDAGIIGVAGINDKNHLLGNILDGPDKKPIGESIQKPINVFSIDEVLFIIKRDFYLNHPLNLNNKTWHLYAVEYSLEMHEMNKKVKIIPARIYHKSNGLSLNRSYFVYLKQIIKKYKKYKRIHTTVGSWYTNKILFNLQLMKRGIHK